jgi:hypothetical protein
MPLFIELLDLNKKESLTMIKMLQAVLNCISQPIPKN